MNKLTPTVKFEVEPIDCFFTLDCGLNWYSGWEIASVKLPFTFYDSNLCLVWDASGTTYWLAAKRIRYRGDDDRFNWHRYQHDFNWRKWQNFTSETANHFRESKIRKFPNSQ